MLFSKIIQQKVVNQETWLDALSSKEYPFRIRIDIRKKIPHGLRIESEHLIWFVTNGIFEGTINGKPERIGPGGFCSFSPKVSYEFMEISNTPQVVIYVLNFQLIHRNVQLRLASDILRVKRAWDLRPYFEQLLDEQQFTLPHQSQRVRFLMSLIYINAFRRQALQVKRQTVLSQAQGSQLTRYMLDHVAAKPAPSALAKELKLSKDYFSRVFFRTFGLSPRRWIVRERIRLAALKLVESTSNITEIAYEFGYKDAYLFSRQFKKFLGVSPRSYRRSHSSRYLEKQLAKKH